MADYHLHGIPPAFGGELGYVAQGSGDVLLTARLNAADDLVLATSHADFVFRIPAGYPESNSAPISVTLAPGHSVPPGVSLDFPWMQRKENSSYPLAVWFYTVRQALMRGDENQDKAATPVLLRQTFPYPLYRAGPGAGEAPSSSTFGSGSGPGRGIRLTTGGGRTRGKRQYMEDVDFVHALNVSSYHKQMVLVGVCDGHGGAECAQFLSDELPAKVSQLLKQQAQRTLLCADALFQAFLAVDKEYLASCSNNAGSTACVLLWDGGEGNETCHVANTGDTRAVLCRSGRAIDLTIDKKASDPDEVARVARAGGFVSGGRVQGSLAVSRAIGDSDIKKGRGRFAVKGPDGSRVQGVTTALIADPEITSFRPLRTGIAGGSTSGEEDQFILIATDGLWDVMTSQQAIDALLRRAAQTCSATTAASTSASTSTNKSAQFVANSNVLARVTEQELQRLADWLASEAVAQGSQDNVTVRIVVFHGEAFAVPSGGAPIAATATPKVLPATKAGVGVGIPETTVFNRAAGGEHRSQDRLANPALAAVSAPTMLIPPRSLSPLPGAAPVRDAGSSAPSARISSDARFGVSASTSLPPRPSSLAGGRHGASTDSESESAAPYASRVIGTVGSSRFGRSDSNSSIQSGGSDSGKVATGGAQSQSKAAGGKAKDEEDIMSFLLDDGNF